MGECLNCANVTKSRNASQCSNNICILFMIYIMLQKCSWSATVMLWRLLLFWCPFFVFILYVFNVKPLPYCYFWYFFFSFLFSFKFIPIYFSHASILPHITFFCYLLVFLMPNAGHVFHFLKLFSSDLPSLLSRWEISLLHLIYFQVTLFDVLLFQANTFSIFTFFNNHLVILHLFDLAFYFVFLLCKVFTILSVHPLVRFSLQ